MSATVTRYTHLVLNVHKHFEIKHIFSNVIGIIQDLKCM